MDLLSLLWLLIKRLAIFWEKYITPYKSFYGDELATHDIEYVDTGFVERILNWSKKGSTYLILSGEAGIGKSRCCIEVAKRRRRWTMWINLRSYGSYWRESPDKFREALDKVMDSVSVYVYDDYEDHPEFLAHAADLVLKKGAKLIVITQDVGSVREAIGKRGRPEEIEITKVEETRLREIINAKANKLKIAEIGTPFIKHLLDVAEGNPGLVVLGLEHAQRFGSLEGINTRDQLFESIYKDMIRTFGDESGAKKLFGKLALTRGLSNEYLDLKEGEFLRSFAKTGRVLYTQDIKEFRIHSNILNDYIAHRIFLDSAISKRFQHVVDEFIHVKAVDILKTLARLKNKEATEILLGKAKSLKPKQVIELGLIAYTVFKEFDLVQKNLGDFWVHVDEVNDKEFFDRTALFHFQLSRYDDARHCWEKALKGYKESGDAMSMGRTLNNLGFVWAACYDWSKSIEYHQQARQAYQTLKDDKLVYGEIESLNAILDIYVQTGDIDLAVELVNSTIEVFKSPREDSEKFALGETLINKGRILYLYGEWQNASDSFAEALEIFRELDNYPSGIKALYWLSYTYVAQERLEEAEHYYGIARSLSKDLGNFFSMGIYDNEFGDRYLEKSRWEKAEECFTRALEVFSNLGDENNAANAQFGLAKTYYWTERADQALEIFDQAAKVFIEAGNEKQLAYIYMYQGLNATKLGRWQEAGDFLSKSLNLMEKNHDRFGIMQVHLSLADIYLLNGHWEKAEEAYNLSMQEAETLGDVAGQADAACGLGSIYERWGQWEEAIRWYEQALNIYERLGNTSSMASVYLGLAIVFLAAGKVQEGFEYAKAARDIFRDLKNRDGEARAENSLANIYRKMGELEEAMAACKRSLDLAIRTRNRQIESYAYGIFGQLYCDKKEWDEAEGYFKKHLTINEELQDKYANAYTYGDIGVMWTERGDLKTAEKFLGDAWDLFSEIRAQGDLIRVRGHFEELVKRLQQAGDSEAMERIENKLKTAPPIGDKDSRMNGGN